MSHPAMEVTAKDMIATTGQANSSQVAKDLAAVWDLVDAVLGLPILQLRVVRVVLEDQVIRTNVVNGEEVVLRTCCHSRQARGGGGGPVLNRSSHIGKFKMKCYVVLE